MQSKINRIKHKLKKARVKESSFGDAQEIATTSSNDGEIATISSNDGEIPTYLSAFGEPFIGNTLIGEVAVDTNVKDGNYGRKSAQTREEELESFLSNLPDGLSIMQLKSRYNRAHGLKKKMREEGLTEAEENQLQELESSYKIGSKLNDMKRALRRAREFESSSLAAVYSNDVLSNIDILRHLKNFDPDKSSFRIDDQNRHIYPLPSSLAKKLGEGWEFCLN